MITVSEARRTLGKKYNHLSDKEVQQLINMLYKLCNGVIDDTINQRGKVDKQ